MNRVPKQLHRIQILVALLRKREIVLSAAAATAYAIIDLKKIAWNPGREGL